MRDYRHMPLKLNQTARWILALVILVAVIALAVIGQRLSPPQQGPSGAQTSEPCTVDTLLSGLEPAAKQWCANGLFSRVSITGDKQNVIAVAQFSANGSQIWQIQSNGLLATFPGLTDKLAAAAGGRSVSVSVHDAADQRVAACARAATDTEAKCELKQAR